MRFFRITKKLITQVEGAHAKYVADLEQKKALVKKENALRKQHAAAQAAAGSEKNEMDFVQEEIAKCELSLKSTDKIISDGKKEANKIEKQIYKYSLGSVY